jgi:predicted dehydrogenase
MNLVGTTQIGVALIGCGRMGKEHLEAARSIAEVSLRAVVDPALTRSEATLDTPMAAWEEVLASPEIDAVIIAAPTPVHATLVREALEAGKHVLCEKPLTLEPDEDLAVGRLAGEVNRVLHVGFWRRFAEPYRLARSIISAGTIGEVRTVRAAQWDAKRPPLSFCDPRVSGGLEVDCGVHEFDVVRWLLDAEVEAVAACAALPDRDLATVDDVDALHGLCRLNRNRVLAIDLTRTAGYEDSVRTELIGELGSVVIAFGTSGRIVIRHGAKRDVRALKAPDVVGDALRRQLQTFSSSVASGLRDPDASSATDSSIALCAAAAMRASRLASGLWQDVRPRRHLPGNETMSKV